MASKKGKRKDGLNLTQEESESMGVAVREEPTPGSAERQERPLHEQVAGALTEDDVTEVLTGEVTPESREDVEDFFADVQEEEADRQADSDRDPSTSAGGSLAPQEPQPATGRKGRP